MAATTPTELWLEPGGDFVQLPNGDLKLAQDTATTTDATTQRIYRLLMTNPRLIIAGVVYSAPDHLFYPDYGAGLPALVGQPIPTVIAQATARIRRWLLKDPTIVQSSIQLNIEQTSINTVQINLTCKTRNGSPVQTTFPLGTSSNVSALLPRTG